MNYQTIYATAVVDHKSDSQIKSGLQLLMGSLFIALAAQLAIFLPFSPVPFTLQSLAIALIGGLWGPRRGVQCVLLYLTEAGLGCPFLAGGLGGPLALIGLRAGYLVGFIGQVYLMGWLYERKGRTDTGYLLALTALTFTLPLVLGALWLSSFIGIQGAIKLGVGPFLAGETLKAFVVVAFIKIFRRATKS